MSSSNNTNTPCLPLPPLPPSPSPHARYLKRQANAYPDRARGGEAEKEDGSLKVWLNARVMRIVFEGTKAVGVELRRGTPNGTGGTTEADHGDDDDASNTPDTIFVRARREVVLCGGAVSTPHLLLLSGVGPAAHLKEKGVGVVLDAPGVGGYMKDHLHVPVCFRVNGGVQPHSHSNICEGSLFARTRPGGAGEGEEDTRPDLQV